MNSMLFLVRLCELWSLNSSELSIKVHKGRKIVYQVGGLNNINGAKYNFSITSGLIVSN